MLPDGSGATVRGWVVVVAVAGTVFLELGAFWLSFTSLSDLARRSDIPADRAWVWPLIVDGIIVEATLAVVALRQYGRHATVYPWILLYSSTGASVAANVAHALVTTTPGVSLLVAALVAAVPPLVQLAMTHLTVELIQYARRSPTAQTPPPSSPVPVRSTPSVAVAGPSGLRTVPLVIGRPAPLKRVEAERWQAQGLSNRQIARELQVHPSTVGRWLAVGNERGMKGDDDVERDAQPEPAPAGEEGSAESGGGAGTGPSPLAE